MTSAERLSGKGGGGWALENLIENRCFPCGPQKHDAHLFETIRYWDLEVVGSPGSWTTALSFLQMRSPGPGRELSLPTQRAGGR